MTDTDVLQPRGRLILNDNARTHQMTRQRDTYRSKNQSVRRRPLRADLVGPVSLRQRPSGL